MIFLLSHYSSLSKALFRSFELVSGLFEVKECAFLDGLGD